MKKPPSAASRPPKGKKVIVNTLMLLSPFTGIARYAFENIRRMQAMAPDYEWYFFYGGVSRHLAAPPAADAPMRFRGRLKAFIARHAFVKETILLLRDIYYRLHPRRFDLYWQPNYIPDPAIKADIVVTSVHDFSFHIRPEWHTPKKVAYYRKRFWRHVQRSDAIITGSEYSKKEIMHYLHFDAEKITVIHHGVDHALYRVMEAAALAPFRRALDLPEGYILFVGSIEPRKNLHTLLRAYHALPAGTKARFPLILAGAEGWENSQIKALMEQDRKNVRYLGYLDDETLAAVYNMATLFVYPSLYEGFGIPPLEAMACGTPVLTTDVSSIPEVCGDAARYVDPNDAEAMRAEIAALLDDAPERERLVQKGLKRAKGFTWEKAARKHLALFETLLRERNGDA